MRRELFAEYRPGSDGPWDAAAARHLLERAGLGATPAEIAGAEAAGLSESVAGLWGERSGAAETERLADLRTQMVDGGFFDPNSIESERAWWVHRMRVGQGSAREKLVLFWHGHFATSATKVEEAPLLFQQNELLRLHAWGSFHDMVRAVARDAAMLVWLDGEANVREHPNENFARELLELFTIGIGHYSEADVRAAARAYSGWHREGAQFAFKADLHDDGPKTFRGSTGRWDGDDIVALVLRDPEAKRFIARKLLTFYAEPEPSAEVVGEAGELLDHYDFQLRWWLADLFRSKYFFGASCRRSRVKSPAEYVVGTARALELPPREISSAELGEEMAGMGQALYAPPSVKGWDGEETWLASDWWLARVRFARRVGEASPLDEAQALLRGLSEAARKDPRALTTHLRALLIGTAAEAETAERLAAFATRSEGGEGGAMFRDDAGFRETRIRELVGEILSLPEYHVV